MFAHVSVWGVLVAALSAMLIGTLWYSPAVFGKSWTKIMGADDKHMQRTMSTAMPILVVASLLTAYVVSLFTVYFHAYVGGSWLMAGLDTSFLAWLGVAATAIFVHGAFDPRDKKLLYINAGNRLVTLLAMGLIIGVFMR